MASTIKLKNGSGAPTTGDLVQGEPALDLTNKRLYTENASGVVIEVGTNPSTIDINAGTIDGTVIGGSTPAAVTTSSLVATTADINAGTIDGTVIGGSTAAAGTFTTGQFNTSVYVDGNVGIGVSTPAAPLSFGSSTNDARIYLRGNTNEFAIGTNGIQTVYAGYQGHVFQTGSFGGTERFRIAADGSLSTPTLGTSNVRFGVNAGNSIIAGGNYNTVVGDEAGTAITTGFENTLIGGLAGDAITTASNNTAVGKSALSANTTASNNTAVGYAALTANTTGTQNVAVGSQSLLAHTTGNYNVAVGQNALLSNTTASDNTSVGAYSLDANTTGANNTAVGKEALGSNTTADNNTAVGYQSLYANTASSNTAVGYQAGYSNTTGSFNTALGYGTGSSSQTADACTYVGFASGNLATASSNTFIGTSSGDQVTTGSKNTIIGRFNGNQGGLDIRTASNNIVLSDGDGNPRGFFDASGNLIVGGNALNTVNAFSVHPATNPYIGLNKSLTGTHDAFYFQHNGSVIGKITYSDSATAYVTSSDYRLKKNVTDITDGIDRLKQLPVHKFNFIADPDTTVDGFLAHEVQDIVPEAITGSKDEVDAEGNPVYQGIDQSKLVPLLTAALKEAITRIETLEAEVAAIKGA
jgi:trimeric autotransporter adhesin